MTRENRPACGEINRGRKKDKKENFDDYFDLIKLALCMKTQHREEDLSPAGHCTSFATKMRQFILFSFFRKKISKSILVALWPSSFSNKI